uniref:BTB domain-containing protein n=1 Tax=Tetradesmus obliquus TaxID=3088 RepID=A0A383WM14_TETOB|eukprot:jgi/Sobl393_1/12925/SZX78209.1
MVEQSFVPDFSEFYNEYELSDVNLFIQEEEHAAPYSSSSSSSGSMSGEEEAEEACEPIAEHGHGDKPRRKALPGHSMVLVAFSAFFKAKLKSWTAGPFNRPEVQLSVPAGQLELGELLLQAMYQCTPDLGSTSQLQLLQLLALADRYGVNKVLSAAVAALQAVPQAELQWETVIGVYTLPPGCTEACKPLMPAVQQQLQQQLGDLELALAHKRKRQRLLALPHQVLLLLQDEQTKVAAENTVFRVIEVWHSHQQQHSSSSSDEELTQLLQQIRMQHCSQPFVATVLCNSPLVAQAFSPHELRLACLCSSAGGVQPDAAVAAAMQKVQCPVLARFPAWVQPKRPASAMTKLSMARQLSLADLQQQLEALQKAGTTNSYTTLVSVSWQGEAFQARLCVTSAAQPADAAVCHGCSSAG